MIELLSEIERFRNWAATADKSFGEWETEYPDWEKIYLFVNRLIKETPVEKWNKGLLNEFLYILARDNECEIIIDALIENPKQFLYIAKQAVRFPDPDARWQIAYGLGEIHVNNEEKQTLLKQFLHDEDEYVRRRAQVAFEVE
ncbi:HEAT repeat domain-containing protein [Neobacillus sp. YIM B06451]|uniref:HEAT repeat domain-containing protein n=1 Tax=Neobacillus sp. YIM B06451 TaxID=3070994 RepID=UPI00292F33D5|nr:HEAT repeat domain-containing protein [Neobacillus sp. YIM B06451]